MWAAPLALVLAAENIVSCQHPSADRLAAELKAEEARLALAEGDVALRHTFDASYRALDEPSARIFRLLGLLPGQVIDVAATAVTAGSATPRPYGCCAIWRALI